MRTLVSKTKRKLRALQQRLQGFGRQPACAGFSARLVLDLAERRKCGGHEVPQPEAQQRLHLLLFLGGRGVVGSGDLGIASSARAAEVACTAVIDGRRAQLDQRRLLANADLRSAKRRPAKGLKFYLGRLR